MTSRNNQEHRHSSQSDWLKPYREAFIEHLHECGYSQSTTRLYERTVNCFCTKASTRSLAIDDLDSDAVVALRKVVVSSTTKIDRTYARFRLERFIDHLVETGVVVQPEQPTRQPTAIDLLCEEYEAYLRDLRGLSEATIRTCVGVLCQFTTFRFGVELGDLSTITSDDIVTFLCLRTAKSPTDRVKVHPTHLRNFFKFLFWSGKTRLNLAKSIPRVAKIQPIKLPRYLKPEEVQRLIDSVRTDDAIGRRNYAMLLLTARLGLRGPEVISIQIEDIDWRSGEILIRGKGKRHDRMPIPTDVGEAIVDYLRYGRRSASRTLFVCTRAPHRPFKDAQIVNAVLRKAFKKTGLKSPQRYVGSHVLRHSLATDLLRKGASLDEIRDVLRHRSIISTTIYAKYDIDALRSIARAWPVQGDGQ